MKREGIATWNERDGDAPVDRYTERFLVEVFDEPWASKPPGRALELGCGTAPLLRWLRHRGWDGIGVDVSPTAIGMGREQSAGLGLELVVGDVLRLDFLSAASVDLVVDGHCFHCLTDPADHPIFFREVARVLKPGGGFVLNTMCSPVNRKAFRARHGVFRDKRIYSASKSAPEFEGMIEIRGKPHMPVRYLEDWRLLLRALPRHGLRPRIIRLALSREDEPFSGLCVGAVKE
jgi:SAM-dependent methyltransferase